MAGPIYCLWIGRPTEAWYRLSEEEREQLNAKHDELFEKTGGKNIVSCISAWSSEQWPIFGVHVFPDIEAVHKHSENLMGIEWNRYIESKTMLGTEWPEQP